jgi:gamma-glutamyl phosphate reductase
MEPSKTPKRPSNDDATSATTISPQSKNKIQLKKLSLKEEIISKCNKKLLNAASFEYQKQLNEQCEFNDEAIQEMAENLNQLLTSPNKIERIATKFPKRTAVKTQGECGT